MRISGFANPAGTPPPTRDDARLVLALILEDMQATLAQQEAVLGKYSTKGGQQLYQLFCLVKDESMEFMERYYHHSTYLDNTPLCIEEVSCKGQRLEIVLVLPTVAACGNVEDRLATERALTHHIAPHLASIGVHGGSDGGESNHH